MGYIGVYGVVLGFMGSMGLHWGLWGTLGSMGLHWDPLGDGISIGFHWVLWGCGGLHWVPLADAISIGVHWVPLGSIGSHWDPLGSIGFYGVVGSSMGSIGSSMGSIGFYGVTLGSMGPIVSHCPHYPPVSLPTGAPIDPTSIQVFVLPPTPLDLYVSQTPQVLCMAINLPSDEGLAMTWTKGHGHPIISDGPHIQPQFNGTYTATSKALVATGDWESGTGFTCRVEHRDLPAPISRSVARMAGQLLPPSVYLLPPPWELTSPHPTLTLTCLARGFHPASISVQWQREQRPLGRGQAAPQPIRERQGVTCYFLYSRLDVERGEWERGTRFGCMVVHEALPMRFIQRSVHRDSGK
uniref:Uncharacterized protein n=1 Tax=Melopsittacus undulatus TaxID=13146 RepID=A0A8V5GCC7_MELUD